MDNELLRIKNLFQEKAKRVNAQVELQSDHDHDSIRFSYHSPCKGGTVWKGVELVRGYGDSPAFTLVVGASSYHPLKEALSHLPVLGKFVSKPKYLSWRERVAEFKGVIDRDKLSQVLEETLTKLEDIDRVFLEKNQR